LEQVAKADNTFTSISVEEVRASPTYKAMAIEIASLDHEIALLVERVSMLPPDYISATAFLTKELSALRERRGALLASMSKMETSVGASQDDMGMVGHIAGVFGLPPSALLLFLLLMVSGSIEAGALVLTARAEDGKDPENQAIEALSESKTGETPPCPDSPLPMASYSSPIAPETFLRAAMEGADLPYLNGRDKTARKFNGLSFAEAKRLVAMLIRDGKIVVEGKRLKLSSPINTPNTPIPAENRGALVG
jgi:hypothetical protein